MCCDNSGCGLEAATEECPDCGNPVDPEGWTYDCCNYSPEGCSTCGYRPCDGSC